MCATRIDAKIPLKNIEADVSLVKHDEIDLF